MPMASILFLWCVFVIFYYSFCFFRLQFFGNRSLWGQKFRHFRHIFCLDIWYICRGGGNCWSSSYSPTIYSRWLKLNMKNLIVLTKVSAEIWWYVHVHPGKLFSIRSFGAMSCLPTKMLCLFSPSSCSLSIACVWLLLLSVGNSVYRTHWRTNDWIAAFHDEKTNNSERHLCFQMNLAYFVPFSELTEWSLPRHFQHNFDFVFIWNIPHRKYPQFF